MGFDLVLEGSKFAVTRPGCLGEKDTITGISSGLMIAFRTHHGKLVP